MSSTLIVYVNRVGGISAHGLLVPTVLFFWSMSIVSYAMLWRLSPGYAHQQQETTETCFVEANTGKPRHCRQCNLIKPDRAHHCSRCNRCVLKMDHHCPWIGCCVGQYNQRLFLIFLGYTATYALVNLTSLCIIRRSNLVMCWHAYKLYWCTLSCILRNVYQIIHGRHYVPLLAGVHGWSQIDFPFVITLIQGFLFSAVLCGFTGFHLFLVLTDRTTIEHYGNRPYEIRITKQNDKGDSTAELIRLNGRELPFSRGVVQNWLTVMGTNPIYWLVPIHSDALSRKNHDEVERFRQAVQARIRKSI
ncbi:DHHC palmitoyltransferase-domain-containing protein [Dichotomocladium elegans]|nr:DHHC palmitoyltransferase-domain-containing protein [Dichotomocladium elegans]